MDKEETVKINAQNDIKNQAWSIRKQTDAILKLTKVVINNLNEKERALLEKSFIYKMRIGTLTIALLISIIGEQTIKNNCNCFLTNFRKLWHFTQDIVLSSKIQYHFKNFEQFSVEMWITCPLCAI